MDEEVKNGTVTSGTVGETNAAGNIIRPAANATAEQKDEAMNANTKSYADSIAKQYDAYAQQQANTIDNRVRQKVNDAQYAYADKIRNYQQQYRTLTANMYQNADNAALEARASGRFGGMATADVNNVQSAYQKQRQQLSLQQQKLATDTVREIEELRANGEFDKADALLRARQQQFQALYEDAVRVDENRYSNAQYETSLQREDAQIQRDQEQNDKNYLRQLGQGFLNAGVMPSTSMLEAMGIDQSMAQSYVNAVLMGY